MKKIKSGYSLFALDNNDRATSRELGSFKSAVEAVGVAKRVVRDSVPSRDSSGYFTWMMYGETVIIESFGSASDVPFCNSTYVASYCGIKAEETS